MINKNKLISELENVIYGSNMSKEEADNLLTNFIDLVNKLKLKNCSVNILQNPIKLVIKNKAYDNRVFLDFIKNMVVFCSTKVSLTASEYVSTTYIIYDTANTTYNDKYNINTNDAKKMMLATDIIQIMNNIITLVRQNMRNKVVSYRVVMSL